MAFETGDQLTESGLGRLVLADERVSDIEEQPADFSHCAVPGRSRCVAAVPARFVTPAQAGAHGNDRSRPYAGMTGGLGHFLQVDRR
jgi:hypothetical protein